MNKAQLERMQNGKGFIAALDQSGGSTPKALKKYGIAETEYKNDEEMFDLIHKMRERIIKSPSFTSEHILGAILFEKTMDRTIDGIDSADFLWDTKGVVPFLKVDKGLAELQNGVQLMKPMPNLEELLDRAVKKHIFGTKMRSVIKEKDETGIKKAVKQQFETAKKIISKGLVPIIEPEVDINAPDKAEIETILHAELKNHIEKLTANELIMLKLTIPTNPDLYLDLTKLQSVVRVVALSGGYSREKANELLSLNHDMIASFSRALTEGTNAKQSDDEFDETLKTSIKSIYDASIK